jgi:hypothetical protein
MHTGLAVRRAGCHSPAQRKMLVHSDELLLAVRPRIAALKGKEVSGSVKART